MASAAEKNWLPVESNPDVFNGYCTKLGFPASAGLQFCDVLSVEDWALDMVQRPVKAVLMLYRIKDVQEAHREQQEALRAAAPPAPAGVWWMKQHIANACGTIGLLHAVANVSTLTGGDVELPEGSWFAKFIAASFAATPDERANALAEDAAIEAGHAEVVSQGQSAQVDDTQDHFVCFVHKAGRLWELDGRKGGPVDCGAASDDLLKDATEVVKQYMARDPEELRFTMLALAPPLPEED